MRLILLIPIMALSLSACATPRERCERDAVRDLRQVQSMIAQTEANLRRGYGLEEVVVGTETDRTCTVDIEGRERCTSETRPVTETRATRLDLEAEAEALNQLRQTERRLSEDARAALAYCATLPAN